MPEIRFHTLMATTLYLTIIVVYWVLAAYYPVGYIWATYEDLYGEWIQTYFFATACLGFTLLTFSGKAYRWFFALLAVALCYVVMEEISWGQRLLGFETPEFFKRHNLQREANIHNLLVGPISTVTKDVIEYALAGALLTYGLLYPLTLRLRWRLSLWVKKIGIAPPPLYLWPFFVTAAIFETAPFRFNEAEIAEILVSSALALMSVHYWHLLRYASTDKPAKIVSPGRLALMMVLVCALVTGLAVVTTLSIYSNRNMQARIHARLLNGYEKFADRYQRFGQWDTAEELYQTVYKRKRRRTSLLRRIADTYLQRGDHAGFTKYNQRALDMDLKRYAKNPDRISTNLSLYHTYQQRTDMENANLHLQRAHKIALRQAASDPDSHRHAYWLGKTYRQLGDNKAALNEFNKAFRLQPDRTKYRKAYLKMRAKVDQQPFSSDDE